MCQVQYAYLVFKLTKLLKTARQPSAAASRNTVNFCSESGSEELFSVNGHEN